MQHCCSKGTEYVWELFIFWGSFEFVYIMCTENNSLWGYLMLCAKLSDLLILMSCLFTFVKAKDTQRTKTWCQECMEWFQWSIIAQLFYGRKLKRSREQEKGVVSVKMKNFIHRFKFMLRMNWMGCIILSFQAKVGN